MAAPRLLRWILVLLAALGVLLGCGGSSGGSDERGSLATGLTVGPTTVTLRPGDIQVFTAYLSGGVSPVNWSIMEGAAGGTITSAGIYTAPSTPGTYRIRANIPGTNIAGTATVTVTTVAVTISTPATLPIVIPRSRVTFGATVQGAVVPGVTWSASSGTITTAGVWTAPTAPGTYTISARSVEDPAKRASIDVTVVADADIQLEIEGKGTVVLDLRPDEAPRHAANMVSLVNEGFYDGTRFHRDNTVDTGAPNVIQGGDPNSRTFPFPSNIGTGGPGYSIDLEVSGNDLLHTRYALAMARSSNPNSAGSQFYICLEALPFLDGQYTVFGTVRSGQAVVDTIRVPDRIVTARVVAAP